MTREEAKKRFWTKQGGVFTSMFHRMNHVKEAIKILDNGGVLDKFIDEIFDAHEKELEDQEEKITMEMSLLNHY